MKTCLNFSTRGDLSILSIPACPHISLMACYHFLHGVIITWMQKWSFLVDYGHLWFLFYPWWHTAQCLANGKKSLWMIEWMNKWVRRKEGRGREGVGGREEGKWRVERKEIIYKYLEMNQMTSSSLKELMTHNYRNSVHSEEYCTQ